MRDETFTDEVRRYMQRIGAKGGAAGKGTAKRKEVNRRSAKRRWATLRADSKAKPKRPKKKRPQAPVPDNKRVSIRIQPREDVGLKGDEVVKAKMAWGPKIPIQTSQPVIGLI